jgi:adenine-specific DNA-methyltransferase
VADAIDKFQQLLSELFQFDCADLDFGIYRIMNYKREVIEKFIAEKLPDVVDDKLKHGELEQQDRANAALDEARQDIINKLGADAIDDDGELAATYRNSPIGRNYLNAKARAAGSRSRAAVEVSIYNHLYAFFSRYYQNGDFISKRRYGRQRYAIPYNGEEVYLHWANSDQYYIKTGEHFRDYDWKAPDGVMVHFRLKAADVEQNNVKGDKRFFLPRAKETKWDTNARAITIPFEYRPLTTSETRSYGNRDQQDKIIAEALDVIPKRLSNAPDALAGLTGEWRRNGKDEPVSHLEHHLRQYTRRNTSDFFIHKDLAAFLSRELDFFLKSEVLNLDEMTAAGEGVATGWFQELQLTKLVGNQVIEFLAQMENFQKMLWEKRKFVTETQYCITLGNIDAAFYPDIAANDAQWDEWRELFHIDETETHLFNSNKNGHDKRIDFLNTHMTLVLDTVHFESNFVDRLLASFDDLDGLTDGLLIHSENWQALNLLTGRYREEVKCIYIDPPYNTGDSEILYKNGYKDSAWLTMMKNRLTTGKVLLEECGMQCTMIDDVEFHMLKELIAKIFGSQNITGVAVIKNNPSGRSTVKGFSISHEYAIFSSASENAALGAIPRTEEQLTQYPEEDEIGKFQWRSFLRSGGENDFRTARPKLHYPLVVSRDTVRLPAMEWNSLASRWKLSENPCENEEVLWPIYSDKEYTWRLGVDTLKNRIGDLRVRQMQNGCMTVEIKFRLDDDGVLPKTVWDEKQMNATSYGTTMLRNIMGKSQVFSFPKSVYAIEKSLRVSDPGILGIVLDYFAGSGTTGHAVINLNREDGGQRKFILVEMGEYFDTVLLPRIKKVTFSPEWKDGKPKRDATPEEAQWSPRIVKYIRLESYEDALNSIEFDDDPVQLKLLKEALGDDYLLKYMLKWETKHSETLLNVEKMVSPFCYRLRVHADGETHERTVDLPETFNYLLGLKARTRRVYKDGDRHYLIYRGETREAPGLEVEVIWRETDGWKQADFERDRQFVAEQGLAEGADAVYVNGDSCIPNAKAIEPLFKARMFAGVEQ